MDLYQDEALEKKPTICLDNRQIQNLKIQQAQVGQVFSLKAAAKVVAMSAGTGERAGAQTGPARSIPGKPCPDPGGRRT